MNSIKKFLINMKRIVLRKIKYHFSFLVFARLKQATPGNIQVGQNDLLVITGIRNEIKRIPFFLKYYRSKGVDKFFIIDNNSEDGTKEMLLSEKDVYLFTTDEPFSDSSCGLNWIQAILKKYCKNKWCLLLDADEFFVYPHCEEISIKDLCFFLENERKNAIKIMLLDMYADGFPSIDRLEPLWEVFPYFDRDSHYLTDLCGKPAIFGGMRKRIFNTDVCLQKVPLIKYSTWLKPKLGIHRVLNARLSQIEGVLLHFKFDSLFAKKAKEESQRKEHWNEAAEYKQYLERLDKEDNFTIYDPMYSVRYENSRQLIEMKFIKTSEQFEKHVAFCRKKSFKTKNIQEINLEL